MFLLGIPIAGTGAGLRPIGQDPNFVADFREIFNISVPILENEDKIDQVDILSAQGWVQAHGLGPRPVLAILFLAMLFLAPYLFCILSICVVGLV